MRLPFLLLTCLAPAPLAAQDQAPLEVEFDLAAQRPAAKPQEQQPVMVQFDLNGNPIGPGTTACHQPGAGDEAASTQGEDGEADDEEDWGISAFLADCPAVETAAARTPATNDGSNTFGFGRDPFSVTNASNSYSRSSTAGSGEDGNVRVEREYTERCTETLFERTCSTSGSITVGNSEAARNSAREAIEALRRDD